MLYINQYCDSTKIYKARHIEAVVEEGVLLDAKFRLCNVMQNYVRAAESKSNFLNLPK
jgi:hypothetical protein